MVKKVGKSALEKKWIAAELDLGIYPTLKVLEELAREPKQKEHVIRRLHQLAREKPPVQLPQISFLLCRLGDRRFLADVHDKYKLHQRGGEQALWDDRRASSNATDYAIRQLILYGTRTYRDELSKGISGDEQPEADIMRSLFDLAVNRYGRTLPEEYDKSEFPLYMLVSLLEVTSDSSPFTASQYPMRWCDWAAASIQVFTGLDFAFNEEDSVDKKDAAIARILEWWGKKQEVP